jgi:hypothetical protein
LLICRSHGNTVPQCSVPGRAFLPRSLTNQHGEFGAPPKRTGERDCIDFEFLSVFVRSFVRSLLLSGSRTAGGGLASGAANQLPRRPRDSRRRHPKSGMHMATAPIVQPMIIEMRAKSAVIGHPPVLRLAGAKVQWPLVLSDSRTTGGGWPRDRSISFRDGLAIHGVAIPDLRLL